MHMSRNGGMEPKPGRSFVSRDPHLNGFTRLWASRRSIRLAALGGSGALALAAAAAGPAPESGHTSGVPRVSNVPAYRQFGNERRRATDIFLLLNVLGFALQWLSKDLVTLWGAKVNALIAAGQLWRLVTPTFLHSGFFHLMVNSYALHSFGPDVEQLSGTARTAAIYMTSAVTGTLASFIMTPSPSLGSSAAIFGLGAALAMFYWRHKNVLREHSDAGLRSLGITVALNLGYSLLVKNIDNWGHLGGMLGGAVMAWVLGPRLVKDESGRYGMVDRPPVPLLAFEDGKLFGMDRATLRPGRGAPSPAGLKYSNKKSRKQVEKGERLFPEHTSTGQQEEGESHKSGKSEKRRRWWHWPWRGRKAESG